MAEHGVDQIIGISADGVGYGSDGKSWGGEVMVANFGSFERLGGLMEQRIPGGDLAAIFPARMVAGTLWEVLEPGELRKVLLEFCATGFRHGRREIDVVLQQLGQDLNVPRTTSCGRVLDAISCLLGICQERTYEGEPAIKLEAVANTGDTNVIKLKPSFREVNGRMVVDTSKLLLDVLNAVRRGLSRRHIAAAAQIALAQGLGEIAVRAAKEEGFKIVGVSGGVFCNRAITRAVRKVVEEERLSFIQHELLPLGDGGISVGQAVSASVGKLLC
jgi:hydrogenase maturation protein HypF